MVSILINSIILQKGLVCNHYIIPNTFGFFIYILMSCFQLYGIMACGYNYSNDICLQFTENCLQVPVIGVCWWYIHLLCGIGFGSSWHSRSLQVMYTPSSVYSPLWSSSSWLITECISFGDRVLRDFCNLNKQCFYLRDWFRTFMVVQWDVVVVLLAANPQFSLLHSPGKFCFWLQDVQCEIHAPFTIGTNIDNGVLRASCRDYYPLCSDVFKLIHRLYSERVLRLWIVNSCSRSCRVHVIDYLGESLGKYFNEDPLVIFCFFLKKEWQFSRLC